MNVEAIGRRKTTGFAIALICLTVTACSSTDAAPNQVLPDGSAAFDGAIADGGASETDAGRDAGFQDGGDGEVDGGSPDGGAAKPDAGDAGVALDAGIADGGMGQLDSGLPVDSGAPDSGHDAGLVEVVDAGQPTVDAGPELCGGSVCLAPDDHSRPLCQAERCLFQCLPGWANCSGVQGGACSTHVAEDRNHCGHCEDVFACADTEACIAGRCVVPICESTQTNCLGVCSNLDDMTNCGACGNSCPAEIPHAVSYCQDATRCSFHCDLANHYYNCNGDVTDGCEAHIPDDPLNCGNCGNVCRSWESCVMGACRPN